MRKMGAARPLFLRKGPFLDFWRRGFPAQGRFLMKSLIVYSSRTGNTKKVAEAIASVLPDCDLHPVESAPSAEGYDLIAVGYWADRGKPDARASAYLQTLRGTTLALFGTLGAWPDSDHARDCAAAGEALAASHGNTVLGTFLCQGRIDPKVIDFMRKKFADRHPMTPERLARIREAEKHPDAEDCRRARELFLDYAARVGEHH